MAKNKKHDQHCLLKSCQISNVIPSSEATEVGKKRKHLRRQLLLLRLKNLQYCQIHFFFAAHPSATLKKRDLTEFLGRALIFNFYENILNHNLFKNTKLIITHFFSGVNVPNTKSINNINTLIVQCNKKVQHLRMI